MQTVTTKLRHARELPELSPAHRLDRVTSGLLLLTKERRWRGAYQSLFQARGVSREYHALAPTLPTVRFPVTVENHLHKVSGEHTVRVVGDAPPNARSVIDVDEVLGEIAPGLYGAGEPVSSVTRYRLTPRSGKTHQLRQHMLSIGAPIIGDPLYPLDLQIDVDDFSTPLQLLAHRMRFIDPVDQRPREFFSRRRLPLSAEQTDR